MTSSEDQPAGASGGAEPFDPYRFGKPDFPVPPEFAPPGYVPDPVPNPAPRPSANAPGNPPYYSPPPPPPYHSYVQPRTGNGKAIASMVLGIAAILLSWLALLDLALIVPAVVLGILALTEKSRSKVGPGRREGRGMAITGVVCATVAALIAALMTVLFVHAANQCGGIYQSNRPDFNKCLQQHLKF